MKCFRHHGRIAKLRGSVLEQNIDGSGTEEALLTWEAE